MLLIGGKNRAALSRPDLQQRYRETAFGRSFCLSSIHSAGQFATCLATVIAAKMKATPNAPAKAAKTNRASIPRPKLN